MKQYDWTHNNNFKIVDCEVHNLKNLINKIELFIEKEDYKSDSIFEGEFLTKLGKNDADYLKNYYYLSFINTSMIIGATTEWWRELNSLIDKSDYEYSDTIKFFNLNIETEEDYKFIYVCFTFEFIAYLYNYLTKRNGMLNYRGELAKQFEAFCEFVETQLPYGYQLIGE